MAKTPNIKAVESTTAVPAGVIASADNIDALLAEMGVPEVEVTTVDPTVIDIDSVVAAVARDEAYAKAGAEDDPYTLANPDIETDTHAEEAPAVEAETKPAKEKKAKTPKEPKEKKERIFFSKQSDRIAHQLGDKLSEFMLLELGDATLTGDDLKAKNAEVLTSIDTTAKKVGEKANMLFKWMNKGGDLNEVMARAFKVLVRDGELTSGDKGNLQLDLVSKPYSMGTARSQANQIFMLFPILKITMKEKGKMVPNPDSLIFMKAKAQLGL
jgi:hypothetical protein